MFVGFTEYIIDTDIPANYANYWYFNEIVCSHHYSTCEWIMAAVTLPSLPFFLLFLPSLSSLSFFCLLYRKAHTRSFCVWMRNLHEYHPIFCAVACFKCNWILIDHIVLVLECFFHRQLFLHFGCNTPKYNIINWRIFHNQLKWIRTKQLIFVVNFLENLMKPVWCRRQIHFNGKLIKRNNDQIIDGGKNCIPHIPSVSFWNLWFNKPTITTMINWFCTNQRQLKFYVIAFVMQCFSTQNNNPIGFFGLKNGQERWN